MSFEGRASKETDVKLLRLKSIVEVMKIEQILGIRKIARGSWELLTPKTSLKCFEKYGGENLKIEKRLAHMRMHDIPCTF